MIELERHIEILLLGNDCVIVPGLGGFVAHHVAARFDINDGMFLPPLRTIGFNQQLKMNDSLLAQSYAEAYDISYPDALQRIENDVKTLRKELEEEGIYELNDIGTLRINDEGNIEFTPCEAGILTPEFYGLSSFDLPKLSKGNAEGKEKSPGSSKKDSIIYIDSSPDRKHKTINIRLSALKNISVAAAIIVFSFLIASPVDHTRNGQPTEKVESSILRDVLENNNKAQEKEISFASSKKTISAAKPMTAIAKKESNTDKPAAKAKAQETAATEQSKAPYWCIVLCSHVQLANATYFSSQLTKEGIENNIIKEKNGNAKVVYGSYATEQEAYSALNSKQDNARFKQGWITKIGKAKQ